MAVEMPGRITYPLLQAASLLGRRVVARCAFGSRALARQDVATSRTVNGEFTTAESAIIQEMTTRGLSLIAGKPGHAADAIRPWRERVS